jgi:hypothetical protein
MTLRTITFDDSIYKLVPKKSTEEMGRALNAVLHKPTHSNAARLESDCYLIDLAIAAAPEYQDTCKFDRGMCGIRGYCKDCIQDTKKDE